MTGYSYLKPAPGIGHRPAITDMERTYTFAELWELVHERVGTMPIRLGDVVAVRPENTMDSIVDCLAVWESGGVLQLLNGRQTVAELGPQVAATGAALVVGPDIDLGGAPVAQDSSHAEDGEQLALIVATSGTSGAPRLVQLTWANLVASAEASRKHLRHTPDDRWLAVLPLFHVGGFSIVLRSLLVGGEVVLRRRFDPAATAADLHEVTLASLVGSMLTPILDADPGPYSGVRAVLVGGGPTAQPVLMRAADAGLPVLSTYGMTETASQIATAPLGDGPRQRAVPVPGAEIRIATTGEIEVRGPMVSRGYVGGPRRSAEAWHATGDLGSIDDKGFLRIHGRAGDIIITGGENVMPGEIEDVIRSVPGVRDVAVFGTLGGDWGEQVTAAVVADASIGAIDAAIRTRLAGYKIPRRWIEVTELPRNSLGKVDRSALRDMVEADGG